MIGKTLYKAKIVDGKVKIFSNTIIEEKRKYYYFDQKTGCAKSCLKSDVGVVCFLTQEEAMDYLIKELEHFVEVGETYLSKTKNQLLKSKRYRENIL